MKYESSILKRLIDTYGVVGNPRYISEIIKEFIVQGKERFPELFTYQADWLAHIDEFGLNPTYTVSYTGQSIYAPNTLESPVKSAILTGQTLVNLINGGEVTKNATNNWVVFSADFNADMIKTSTDYTLITYVISNSLSEGKGCDFGVSGGINDGFEIKSINVPSGQTGIYKIKLKTKNVFSQPPVLRQQIFNDVATGSITFKQVLVEGDYTNVDVPYFEGMQSVKMPVLTTSNEDGTKTNILSTSEDVVLRRIGDVQDTLDLMTGEVVQSIGEIVLDGSENWMRDVTGTNTIRYNIPFEVGIDKMVLCSSFNTSKDHAGYDEELLIAFNNKLYVRLSISKASNLAEFKQYLSQNQVAVQYPLVTESIKTVDLSILDQNGQSVDHLKSFNGGTHVYTSSLEGSLVPSVDISVVTNLEETLKMCSLDGNTL